MFKTTLKRTSIAIHGMWWKIVLAAGSLALLSNMARAQGYYPDAGNTPPRNYGFEQYPGLPAQTQPFGEDQFRGGFEGRMPATRSRTPSAPNFLGGNIRPRGYDRGGLNRGDSQGFGRDSGRNLDFGPAPRSRTAPGNSLYGNDYSVPLDRFDDTRERYQDRGFQEPLRGPRNDGYAVPEQGWNAPSDNWNSPLYGSPNQSIVPQQQYGPQQQFGPQQQPQFAPQQQFGPQQQPQFAPQQQFGPQVDSPEELQMRITRRYQNTGFHNLLNLPPEQCIGLYTEVMQMIDSRHLEPTPMQMRVQRGLQNLAMALDNPLFLQVNQINMAPQQLQGFRQALLQTAQTAPVQSSQDAVQIVNWAMQMGQQYGGVRPSAVAMEFVYGAVESLDKYSALVPSERVPGASLQLENNVVGIGVQIAVQNEGALVEKVVSSSPAAQAGLQKNDVIVAVSGRRMGGMSVDQMVEVITGPVGSQVVLGVLRNGQGPFTVTVQRQQIALHSVNDVQMLPNSRIGYLKLDKFTSQSTNEMKAALQGLHQQGMQSLVMDLRGNPGGLLNVAVEISDLFLPNGTIVSTRGRNAADNSKEVAQQSQTWKTPLVVLIDHESASASEIFAAAIQDNQRGVIVGRTSYGKGTVQTQFPLDIGGASLRITTAKFYAPSGREMSGRGVTPDVPVALAAGSTAVSGILDQDVLAAAEIAQRNMVPNQQLLGGLMPNGR